MRCRLCLASASAKKVHGRVLDVDCPVDFSLPRTPGTRCRAWSRISRWVSGCRPRQRARALSLEPDWYPLPGPPLPPSAVVFARQPRRKPHRPCAFRLRLPNESVSCSPVSNLNRSGRDELAALVEPPKLTRADVARQLGVTPQAVSSWLRRLSKPMAQHRRQLLELYGIAAESWDVDESEAA